MQLRCKIILFFLLILNVACIRPRKVFSSYTPPPAPDYSVETNWAALPWKKDSADAIPSGSGEKDLQMQARADVFFIYPTLFFSHKNWNASIENSKVRNRLLKYTMRLQASAFNSSSKIYIPFYRQATFYSFLEKDKTNGQQALELAYQDVENAFKYYLNNYNNGRPFILAGHSQGSNHIYKLLQRFGNDTAITNKLVAVYAIGFSPTKDQVILEVCNSSSQTGCVVSWNSYKWGTESAPMKLASNPYCVNPLSWNTDTAAITSLQNHGGVDRSFRMIPNAADAKIHNGILWTHKPKRGKYILTIKNYHINDVGFYYMNIRRNAEERINAWFEKNKK